MPFPSCLNLHFRYNTAKQNAATIRQADRNTVVTTLITTDIAFELEDKPSCGNIPVADFSLRSIVPLIGGGMWWPCDVNVAKGYSAMDEPAELCAVTFKIKN